MAVAPRPLLGHSGISTPPRPVFHLSSGIPRPPPPPSGVVRPQSSARVVGSSTAVAVPRPSPTVVFRPVLPVSSSGLTVPRPPPPPDSLVRSHLRDYTTPRPASTPAASSRPPSILSDDTVFTALSTPAVRVGLIAFLQSKPTAPPLRQAIHLLQIGAPFAAVFHDVSLRSVFREYYCFITEGVSMETVPAPVSPPLPVRPAKRAPDSASSLPEHLNGLNWRELSHLEVYRHGIQLGFTPVDIFQRMCDDGVPDAVISTFFGKFKPVPRPRTAMAACPPKQHILLHTALRQLLCAVDTASDASIVASLWLQLHSLVQLCTCDAVSADHLKQVAIAAAVAAKHRAVWSPEAATSFGHLLKLLSKLASDLYSKH